MRRWVAAGMAGILSACIGDAKGSGENCSAQSKCGMGVRRVCDDGTCSDVLPDLSAHLQTLTLSLPFAVRNASPKALRVAVVYSKTPDGRRVVCPGTATGPGDVDLPGIAGLSDDRVFNLTAETTQVSLRSVSDVITTSVQLNGPGRLVYVELFRTTVPEDDPVSGGAPIAAGCLADAPYDADPAKATVSLAVAPVN
jgi:hypothetical protein